MMKLGPLDDKSIRQVKKEFNRCKKNTIYNKYQITDYYDSGEYQIREYYYDSGVYETVYKVESLFGKKQYVLVVRDENYYLPVEGTTLIQEMIAHGQTHIVEHLLSFSVDLAYGKRYCVLKEMLTPLSKNENQCDDIELAIRIGNDLLPLLQYLYSRQDIIHCVISPQSIMFDKDFRGEKGLMLDEFYLGNECIGKMTTIAPEVSIHENKQSLCDMYSLGIVMYYYLNGRVYPYENNHEMRLYSKDSLPDPKYGSRRLKNLVVKATMPSPQDRFASPQEMLKELQQCEEFKAFILKEFIM